MTGAIPVHSIRSRGPAHTPTGIAADRVIEPRIGSYPSTTSSRAAASVLIAVATRVVRCMEINPIFSCSLSVRKLRGLGLANKDHAAIEQTLYGRRGLVLGRVEVVKRAVAAASVKPLNVVDILDTQTQASQRLRRAGSEVEARRDRDTLGGGSVCVRVELRVAAVPIGNDAIDEGLLLVFV